MILASLGLLLMYPIAGTSVSYFSLPIDPNEMLASNYGLYCFIDYFMVFN